MRDCAFPVRGMPGGSGWECRKTLPTTGSRRSYNASAADTRNSKSNSNSASGRNFSRWLTRGNSILRWQAFVTGQPRVDAVLMANIVRAGAALLRVAIFFGPRGCVREHSCFAPPAPGERAVGSFSVQIQSSDCGIE